MSEPRVHSMNLIKLLNELRSTYEMLRSHGWRLHISRYCSLYRATVCITIPSSVDASLEECLLNSDDELAGVPRIDMALMLATTHTKTNVAPTIVATVEVEDLRVG